MRRPSSLSMDTRAVASASFQVREQCRMPFLLDQGLRPRIALFHVELVERGIDREGIIAGETGQTKFVHRSSSRADHSFNVEITKTVDAEVFPDFFHRHLVRDQFLGIRKINAVVTSEAVRRAPHPHLPFLPPRSPQISPPHTPLPA